MFLTINERVLVLHGFHIVLIVKDHVFVILALSLTTINNIY